MAGRLATSALLGLLLFCSGTEGHFFGKDVTELNPNSIGKFLKSHKPTLVMFYAPWCGHCKNAAAPYQKAAASMKDMVRFAAVNADEHKSLGGQYGVQGFPTIKYWPADKSKGPKDYQGGRDAAAFSAFALSLIQGKVATLTSTDSLPKLFAKAPEAEKAVLLFTNKKTIPPMIKALSTIPQFKDKLPFGLVKHTNKDVVDAFSVSDFPTLLLVDKEGGSEAYEGQMKYMPIAKWLVEQAKGEGASSEGSGEEGAGEDGEKADKPKPKPKQKRKPVLNLRDGMAPLDGPFFQKFCVPGKICFLGLDAEGSDYAESFKDAARLSRTDSKVAFLFASEASALAEANSVFGEATKLSHPALIAVRKAKTAGGKFAVGKVVEGMEGQDIKNWADRVAMGEVSLTKTEDWPFAIPEEEEEK